MERWYFIRDGIRVGPVAREQLLELVRSGELQPTHKLQKEGSGRWRPASETPGLFGGQPAPAVNAATPMPARPQPAAIARPAATPLPANRAAPPAKLPAAPVAAKPAAPVKPAVPPAASAPAAAPARPAAPAKPAAPVAASTPPTAAPARPPAAAPIKPPVPAPKPAASAPAASVPAKPPVPAAPPAPAKPPAAPPAPIVSGWFYLQDKKKLGPVSTSDLKKLAETGVLKAGDMVMRGGQDKWRTASEVPGLFPPVAAATPAAPAVAAPAPVAPVAAPAPAPVAAKARDEDEFDDEDDEADDEEEDEDDEVEDEEIDVDEFLDRAAECKAKGNYALAAAEYDQLVKILPDEPEGYNGLAWLWATCPDAKVRNGAKAVEYARMAVELASNAESEAEDEEDIEDSVALRVECQETLAVAQAETGNFTAAIATLDGFLADAAPDELPRLKQLRQQFQAKQPVREGGRAPSDSKK